MAKCHYEVLGVSKNVKEKDLRKAWKKLALYDIHTSTHLSRTAYECTYNARAYHSDNVSRSIHAYV